jgi:cellobiose phosphorylase
MNILLNGWLIYQTIVCRLFARTSFYQAGGAFGFRDQLQDVLSLLEIEPELARQQILYHSKHQFEEGDVEHWWHPEKNNGIRTRYSDDLLWFPYTVCEYISTTGDYEILDEITPYIEMDKLKEDEDELYAESKDSITKENIYNHCIRAIEKSLRFRQNGLPEMGSGDWNDGMNKVKGESIWLGFFLYDVLNKFIKLCDYKNDFERKNKYFQIAEKLKIALNTNGWDGRWYKRAYFNDGTPLGSVQNDECKIDSISQSWAVISNAGENDKKYMAMDNLDSFLVDRENMIIRLLTPPFDKTSLEPGYIKSYIPGIRENGGQYTHGVIWSIIANVKLGLGNRAGEYFKFLNPIEHTRTKEAVKKYKTEPFVVAADVYSSPYLIGRGGWTWYTGSSSWLYIAGIKYILGIKKSGEKLNINPCIPTEWKEFQVEYKYLDTNYNIYVKNPNGVNSGVKKIIIDNNFADNNEIILTNDKKTHIIEVELG